LIPVPSNTRVWLAAGVTDIRLGFVQQTSGERPVCLARRQGRENPRIRRAFIDITGGDRLAYAEEDIASTERRINQ
jgi:hypothetical protein